MLDTRLDSPNNRFRAARVRKVCALISKTLESKASCKLLDVGGTYNFWYVWRDLIDWSRTEIVCVNLDPSHLAEKQTETNVRMVRGNACDLNMFSDRQFDVIFSNSVIEHVGLWKDKMAMAKEVDRVASRYLVQTPNFWFPIEPHARTPFLHWLPEPLACRVVMARKCGFWTKASTMDEAIQTVQSAQMIDFAQMEALFPNAKIIRERFMGMTKSLIALRE